jgi:multiple sugar transport system ATP-binding protein
MDEPIGALDAKLREEMRTELRRLHVENESTTVYVTHDQVEAMAMADKIGIMNDGLLQQYDNPDIVYDHPANLFVAQFVGSPIMNVADCQVEVADEGLRLRLSGMAEPFVFRAAALRAQLLAASASAEGLTLGIRPEALTLALAPQDGWLAARVHLIEPLGAYDIVDVALGDESLRVRTPSRLVQAQGDAVWVGLDEARIHLFDKRSGAALRSLN